MSGRLGERRLGWDGLSTLDTPLLSLRPTVWAQLPICSFSIEADNLQRILLVSLIVTCNHTSQSCHQNVCLNTALWKAEIVPQLNILG